MTSIFNLNKDITNIINSECDDQTINDTLESLAIDHNAKCVAVTDYIKHINMQLDAIKQEKARLQALEKALTSKKEVFSSFVVYNMKGRSIDKIEDGAHSIKLIKPKPALMIDNELLIPEQYKVIKTVESFDKRQILNKLKLGESIAGVSIGESKTGLKF